MEQLAVEEKEVTPEVSFADDLNADSLDLVEFITAIEEGFSYPSRRLKKSDCSRRF